MDISNLKVQDGFPDTPALTSFPVIIFPKSINDDSAFTTVEENCLGSSLNSLSLTSHIWYASKWDHSGAWSTMSCYQHKATPSPGAVTYLAPCVTLVHFHFILHMAAGGILSNVYRLCHFSAWNHQELLCSPLVKVQILKMIFMISSWLTLNLISYHCPCYSLLPGHISLPSVSMSTILLPWRLSMG